MASMSATSSSYGGGPIGTSASYVPPDLSHLTEDERLIIQTVMLRQRAEEEREKDVLKKKQDEVLLLENTIRRRTEDRQRLGFDLEATCQICTRTKFADGVGHSCQYCGFRCCARCGGKVTLRSNKMIWVCILCRKKQELLIKTGQWIHSSMATRLQQLEAGVGEISSLESSMLIGGHFDKRSTHRLERSFSGDKPGHDSGQLLFGSSSAYHSSRRGSLGLPTRPLDRASLRRQFSHDAAPPPPAPASHHSSSWSERHRHQPLPSVPSLPKQYMQMRMMSGDIEPLGHSRHLTGGSRVPDSSELFGATATMTAVESGIGSDTAGSLGKKGSFPRQGSRELSFGRGGVENLNWSSMESGNGTGAGTGYDSGPDRSSAGAHRRQLPHQHLSLGAAPPGLHQTMVSSSVPSDFVDTSAMLPYSSLQQYANPNVRRQLFSTTGRSRSSGLEPSTSSSSRLYPGAAGHHRQRRDSFLRNDSLSSDQSENVGRAPMPRPPRPRIRREKLRQQFSLSSSEEELRSTPEFAEDDFYYQSLGASQDQTSFGSGAGGIGGAFKCQKSLKREEILDAKIKRFLAHPITWKPSSDGTKLIGHMILKKNLGDELPGSGPSSAAILGLKIVGGRITESGSVGAVIEKVKKGSIADTVGKLRPCDEVLEWNGRSLQGKTYEEVYDIIAESKQEAQVELIVSRYIRRIPMAGVAMPQVSSFTEPINPLDADDPFSARSRIARRHTDINIPTLGHFSKQEVSSMPRQSSLGAQMPRTRVRVSRSSTISGRIQVKLWYDTQTLQLVVTVVSALELPPRGSGQLRNPYAKIILLPDRRSDLRTRALEITLWDYDRFGCSEFLGEVLIELATAPLDDEAEWYLLGTHEETVSQLRQQQKLYLLPSDRLSPPSTISRLSDSDISEIDIVEYDSELGLNTSRESGRGLLADTSQSSFGSSNSPPLTSDDLRRRTAARSIDYYPHPVPELAASHRRPRGHRHHLLSETMMASSLPSQYEGIHRDLTGVRPAFRKSVSQPSRSLSPAMSLRSPTEYGGSLATVTAADQLNQQALWSGSGSTTSTLYAKKRQLPQVPLARRSRDQTTLDLEERARQWKLSQRCLSTNALASSHGMYSDSEVNLRPSYATEKLFYAHPTQRPASVTHHGRGRGRVLARSMGHMYSPDRKGFLATDVGLPLDQQQQMQIMSQQQQQMQQQQMQQQQMQQPLQQSMQQMQPQVIRRTESPQERQERHERVASAEGHRRDRTSRASRNTVTVTRTSEAEGGEEYFDSSSKASPSSAFSSSEPRPRQGRTPLRSSQLTVQRSLDETTTTTSRPSRSTLAAADKDTGSLQSVSHSSQAPGQLKAELSSTEDAKSEVASEGALDSESGKTDPGEGGSASGSGTKIKGGKLSKAKSSSTSQLSVTGTKKRLGFRKKTTTSISIHRSEEVVPEEVRHLLSSPAIRNIKRFDLDFS